MESDLAISRNVNVKLVEFFVVTKRKCIPESVSDNALEDKVLGVLRGIDVEVDIENIESCYRLKGKVIPKLSKRKDTDKIKSNKKKIKTIDHKRIGLSSGTKVFINESLCGYYKLLWSKC